jgi:hypothetical protein
MEKPMARSNKTAKAENTGTVAGATAPAATSDAIEQQVVAFAEQLGRVVGTVQAKAEGWLDPKALQEQVSRVRDSAASLLQHLGALHRPDAEPARAGGPTASSSDSPVKARGRSGGVVDAPGKKHRKPTPNTPLRARATDSSGRVAKMKVVNANRKRGRG